MNLQIIPLSPPQRWTASIWHPLNDTSLVLPSGAYHQPHTVNRAETSILRVFSQEAQLIKDEQERKNRMAITMFASHGDIHVLRKIHTHSANLNSKCKQERRLKGDTKLHSIQTKEENNNIKEFIKLNLLLPFIKVQTMETQSRSASC